MCRGVLQIRMAIAYALAGLKRIRQFLRYELTEHVYDKKYLYRWCYIIII
jgi:hypothetical protein